MTERPKYIPATGKWICWKEEDGDTHVIPVVGTRIHDKAPTCWCIPTQYPDEPFVWMHYPPEEDEQK